MRHPLVYIRSAETSHGRQGQHQLALGQPVTGPEQDGGGGGALWDLRCGLAHSSFSGQNLIWETLPFQLRCIYLCFLQSTKMEVWWNQILTLQFISKRKPVC